MSRLGGLAKRAPLLGLLFGMAAMASLGLPGFANFAAEVMVFFSGFQDSHGLIGPVQLTTIFALWGFLNGIQFAVANIVFLARLIGVMSVVTSGYAFKREFERKKVGDE